MAARVRNLVKVPPVADDLAKRFAKAGKSLYMVGGSVRDGILGVDHVDLDFATDARPDDVLKIVRGWEEGKWLQGVEFGTVGVQKHGHRLEITTFRAERYDPGSRNPEVEHVATIEADLSRRDFTINAMALRVSDHTFVDPFGGLRDLAAKVLRTPGKPEDSFDDDPLRMLRACRFAAQLDLAPDPALVEAMRAMASRLVIISAERIRDELAKMLDTQHPSVGFELATLTGLCQLFLPELPALSLEQDPIHRHKDVYAHTLAVVEKIVASDPAEPDTVLRMAGLLHDIGKPATRRIGADGVSFHHHEVVGARMAEQRLRALKFSNDFVDEACHLIAMHLRFHGYASGWTDSAVRRYVRDAGPALDRLNRLVRADVTTRNRFKARQFQDSMDDFESRIARLAADEDLKRIRPPLNGNDVMEHLGIMPGPMVGVAMKMLLEYRLDHGEYSADDARRLLDEWARAHGLKQ